MNFKVISFYRYVEIDDPGQLRDQLREYCKDNNILGRILLGKEGLNGAVSGEKESIQRFKLFLHGNPLFADLTFREQDAEKNTYHKLVIKVRDEICVFGEKVDLNNTGVHLSPHKLKEWYKNNEDFVIVDARNDYEFDVGKFKDAQKLPIRNFREFAEVAPKQLLQYKDKKIVFYCTGGVRCEKASAYMKEQGFEHVYQLDGGIINYVNQFPSQHEKTGSSEVPSGNEWQGGLFVFDDRLVSDVGEPITACQHCHKDCEQYLNCHNLDCDQLFICCDDCQTIWNKTCSQECKDSPKQREDKRLGQIIGLVHNYYPKAEAALIKVEKSLRKDQAVVFEGKTTGFEQVIQEMRDDDGNEVQSGETGQFITVPVAQKVRKNDKVVIY
ncbi:hypothetical protein COV20_00245 [Candidatus Woesearchaeota archaeon CG10_big_fil_rev_8_21_14_0_10_45_16]|nr:MAG: hypothetical protein COV20_00245 [Candidatus Woesearchaeota archaeon CG10_big_fil_rev_8_21_14_0_10_45_16]